MAISNFNPNTKYTLTSTGSCVGARATQMVKLALLVTEVSEVEVDMIKDLEGGAVQIINRQMSKHNH